MNGDSRPVRSNQTGVHDDLLSVVDRHRREPYRRPIAPKQIAIFESVDAVVRERQAKLILDSGCGTGTSTRRLAEQFPAHTVIGIDKSEARLRRGSSVPLPSNALLARSDCVDFWRLAAKAQWPIDRHYLLYPNPWPKAKHLQRRWHAHAVLPYLLALGGTLELRSNWAIYVEEFASALAHIGIAANPIEEFTPRVVLSDFEQKYLASKHPLYRSVVELRGVAAKAAAI